MKIGCFVLMRNESPILDPFLDQIDALFDRCLILDHGSGDQSADIVQSRDPSRFSLYRLKASGYPQAAVATHFAREILSRGGCDYLFFLDCDEFLPLADRSRLEAFLSRHGSADVLRLPWLNVCPEDLDGGNIFARRFLRGSPSAEFHKVVLSARMMNLAGHFRVLQGYHDVAAPDNCQLRKEDCPETPVIHIPIQSRVQFAFKLANGHNRLVREVSNLKKGQGYHWVDLARKFATGGMDGGMLRSLAIGYPSAAVPEAGIAPLDFAFPYVRSEYRETPAYISAQIAGLVGLTLDHDDSGRPEAFSVADVTGEVVFSDRLDPVGRSGSNATTSSPVRHLVKAMEGWGKDFASLVEPLFSLPTRLPLTAWQGHIPFMFVLFKLLRPRSYVELGVHNGGSLIAACTAAKTYGTDTMIYGIDTWQGDDHAGHYEGERTYNDLKAHLEANFRNFELMRCTFGEARRRFSTESIDVLHIDGLHTYDAVKEDFTTWFGAMAPAGVILFHDICVYDRGFGVHRFWEELKELFATVEFRHSHGLGVLLLDPHDSRIEPLVALSRDAAAMDVYRGWVSLIAGVLPERMGDFAGADPLTPRGQAILDRDRTISQLRSDIDALLNSTSWKITAPLRALKEHVR